MLISYRDSRKSPSEELALKTWVRLGELASAQMVCRPFDSVEFSRAIEICRRLSCRDGAEALKRMIVICAAAGVAVVVVPGIHGCKAHSASRWLLPGKRALIVLSLRYWRDDQLYFSLFREAGAILAAEKMGAEKRGAGTIGRNGSTGEEKQPVFDPDDFARRLLVPPAYDAALAEIAALGEGQAEAIVKLAARLQIAPGLLVGRMQHDRLIPWRACNRLKRELDLSWVLESAAAIQETWPNQTQAAQLVMRDLNLEEHEARGRLRRAAASGALRTNQQLRNRMRIEPQSLTAWRLSARDRDLNAADPDGDAEAA